MRQIGTLPDGDTARRLADYLLTLHIETRLDQQPEGWIVWVCDEDRVPEARQQIAEFLSNPADARFISAAGTAQELRLREIEEDEAYRERMTEFRERMKPPLAHLPVITAFLIVVAVVVTLTTNFGSPEDGSLVRYLWISAGELNLTQIAHGQLWRLLTPIFIHMEVPHLLFNCFAIYSLAGAVERLQGNGWLAVLVLLFAVPSNLAQFYLGHPANTPFGLVLVHSPYFGGLSGVGYGLFGYIWMKSRLQPELGLRMTTGTVFIMMAWFVACFVGLVEHVANAAHAGGLAAGLVIGAAPYLWQFIRRR
jgi:GlpG protein